MALTLIQRYPESADISLKESTVNQEWAVLGTAGETPAAVYAMLRANLPAAYEGLYLQNFTPKHKGADFWDVGVRYGKAIQLQAGQFKFSGKTSGAMLHREVSLETMHVYTAAGADGGDYPDFEGLIGVHKDKVDGVDVVAQNFSFTITLKVGATGLSPTWLAETWAMKPSVNDGTLVLVWKGQTFTFQRGELLFADLTFNDGGRDEDEQELFEIVYEFVYSKNETDLTLGDIDGIVKEGHQYAWSWGYDTVSNDFHSKKPWAWYVERVYEYSDFTQLGLS